VKSLLKKLSRIILQLTSSANRLPGTSQNLNLSETEKANLTLSPQVKRKTAHASSESDDEKKSWSKF